MAGAEQVSPVNVGEPALGRVPAVALLVAAAYGVVLVVAAFTLPFYDSASSSSSGETGQASDTLVGVNGLGVALLGVPLLVTLAVGVVLWQRSRWSLPIAWTLTGLLAAANLLAMASIGIFVLPVTAALVLACVRSGPPAQPPALFPPPQWAGS